MLSASPLARLRQSFKPPLPQLVKELSNVAFFEEELAFSKEKAEIQPHFPHIFGKPLLTAERGRAKKGKALRVGVVFSGGQAAGGHNVASGLFDALYALHPESKLIGFLNGPAGIIEGKYKELTREVLEPYRNMGGFDLLGSGRTKIETAEQLDASLKVVQKLKLDGLVIVGGDDSNTNAAFLAEYFLVKKAETKVVGVPKTIDGDLKSAYVELSFGFDTATKVYAELIGNIARDALSAQKYYHFIKLMGRTASHITLECALSTCPNMAIISEECASKNYTLEKLVLEIADLILLRAQQGKNYGVILVPEGLIEFLTGIKALLPELERDPHGNVQVSLIETERLLIDLVKKELTKRKESGKYTGTFAAQSHFLGYEGRAAFPSNFDATYCNALGYSAALLLAHGYTGYMATVRHLSASTESWMLGGVPLSYLMHMEVRKGKRQPVVQKALVDLKGRAFKHFEEMRKRWALEDRYRFPGPTQFFGDSTVTNELPLSITV